MLAGGPALPDGRHPADNKQGRPQLVAGQAHQPDGVHDHGRARAHAQQLDEHGPSGRPHTQSGAAGVAHGPPGHAERQGEQHNRQLWRVRPPQEGLQGQVLGQAQRRVRSARSGHLRRGDSLARVHAQDARVARRARRRPQTHQEHAHHQSAKSLRLSYSA